MANYYVPLPQYQYPRNAVLDTDGLNNAILKIGQKLQNQAIGEKLLAAADQEAAPQTQPYVSPSPNSNALLKAAIPPSVADTRSFTDANPETRAFTPASITATSLNIPDDVRQTLPAGMRNNNPGNIIYTPASAKYPGVTGPSKNLDMGYNQLVFDDPQSGMNAAAKLALRKYSGGARTTAQLVSGANGWTPGNTGAAANIARSMGIGPNDDLNLSDPDRMAAFLRALTLQEHGKASSMYPSDMYGTAARSGSVSAPAPQQNRLLAAAQPASTQVAGPNYAAAASEAFKQGNVETGIAMLNQQRQNTAADLDVTAKRQEIAKNDAALQDKIISRIAGIAQTVLSERDPARKAAMTRAFISANPQILSHLDKYNLDPNDPDTLMKFIVADAQGVQKAGSVEYGTTPQYYRDDQGNLRIGQLSKAGGIRPVDVPGTVVPGVEYKDTGTEYTGFNKKTGDAVGVIPKNVAAKEREEQIGQGQGKAIVNLPEALRNSEYLIKNIDNLASDEKLSGMTGWQGYLPNVSSSSRRVQSKLDQVQGQTFLQAFSALKGAGAITDTEGAKATDALNRLRTVTQGDEDYVTALREFRDEVGKMYDLAQEKAGIPPEKRKKIPAATGGLSQSPSQQTSAAPVDLSKDTSGEQYAKLPSGTRFIAPDGSERVKP